MADVIEFPSAKRRQRAAVKHKTLCKSGFHKWAVDTKTQFDVKLGQLLTTERCSRCGQTRTVAR